MLSTLLIATVLASAGSPPPDTLGARDIAATDHLPPLHNQPTDPLYRSLAGLQVLARAARLGLTQSSAAEAWKQAPAFYAQSQLHPTSAPQPFTGHLASELNRAMARPGRCDLRVTSPVLLLDQPIYPGDHCTLDLAQTELKTQGFQPYQVQIKGRTDVRLTGGRFTAGLWGVSVAHSRGVTLTGLRMQSLTGGGIMITNSHQVTVTHCRLTGLGGAGIMLHGDTQHAVLVENEILNDTGWSNWHAGIVITDRNADPADDATTLLRPDGILVRQTRITDRLTLPHDNLILRNQVTGNKTSGIYSDGGARNLYLQNTILNNSKEGLCLDNGSTANVVAFNLVRGNGNRWGMTDADLKRDFVSTFGRLPDGTSPAKLPGISLDNAAYNQVLFNQVDRNYGSGIKMVRTSFYNLLGVNTLTDDNEGDNPRLHFFGIIVGYVASDAAAWDLDFAPSRGNQIFANTIRGSHYSGIYFQDGADRNAVFDNTIFGATHWALESTRQQPEDTLNNLTNLPSRNVDNGLDPRLLQLSHGQRD